MGSWFSNFHVHKKDTITQETVIDYIVKQMACKGFHRVDVKNDADTEVAILMHDDSPWISVYSDVFIHDDPESCAQVVTPISAALDTDVMGIACFDSDYLYLNLINAKEEVNGWIGIGHGKDVGISKRNSLAAWKKKVADYPSFSQAAKEKYICAEEFLSASAGNLGLPMDQSGSSLEYLPESKLHQDAVYLYFQGEAGIAFNVPHIKITHMRYAQPCFAERENGVHFLNVGKESHGLSVYFMGPYVENEEITFSDVKIKQFRQPSIKLELQKFQLPDGQWVYGCHAPEIMLPPGVPKRMKWEKRYNLELNLKRQLSFIPHGNPRKMLDITVLIVPDADPNNQAVWNIWKQYGSKEEFIKQHNRIWKRVRAFETDPNQLLPLLKLEDFDE